MLIEVIKWVGWEGGGFRHPGAGGRALLIPPHPLVALGDNPLNPLHRARRDTPRQSLRGFPLFG